MKKINAPPPQKTVDSHIVTDLFVALLTFLVYAVDLLRNMNKDTKLFGKGRHITSLQRLGSDIVRITA